jgi:hypothetical protein
MKLKNLIATTLASALLLANARADITTGLAAYLNLNETNGISAADSSGNGNNATLQNPPGDNSEWTTAGRFGGAARLNFGGVVNQYFTIPDAASLNFGTVNAFTLSAWVIGATTQPAGGAVICKGTGGGNEQYNLDINGNKFRFFIRNSAGAATPITSTVGPSGAFQHVTAVYDGSIKSLKIYVNGQLNVSSSNAANASLKVTAHEVSIGSRQSAAAGYNLPLTNAILDEVRIYNRALTAADVYELYSSGGHAPIITTQPRNVSCYQNDTPVLAVAVDQVNSILPLGYQWQLNGANIAGATAANLVLTNVQFAAAGTYSVLVSNIIGVTASSNAVLQVASLPPSNITDNLVGYWTLNDASGSTTAADSTANANPAALVNFSDYSACWTNGLIGGGLFFNADASTINVLALPNVGITAPTVLDFSSNGVFTLAAWLNGNVLQTNGAAIFARGTGNGGEQFVVDVNAGKYRLFVRNAAGVVSTITTTIAPNNTWQHLVFVLNTTNGIMNAYINGQLAGAAVAPLTLLSNAHEISIGNRQSASAAYNLPWSGAIDDIRFYNRDLTSADVQALYLTGGVFPPAIVTQPTGTSLYVGDNFKMSGLASGTFPLTYQWQKNGVNLPGATNTSLIFNPLQSTNGGNYTLVANNPYGTITSAVAVVQLTPFFLTNALAGYWNFDDGSGSGIAADSSPNGNTATLISFPDTTSEWVTGRVNGAVSFNPASVNEYASIPDSPSLNFNSNLTFTIAAWVKGPSAQISGAGIVAKGQGGINEEYALDVHTDLLPTPGYRFYVRNAAGGSIAMPTPVAPNNQWQHIVATYDGNFALMNFYVNGQPVATNTAAPATLLADNNHEVSIGSRESSATSGYNFGFAGLIDDVRIYNRALSANDVQTLFAAAGGLAPVFYTQPEGASKYVGDGLLLSALVDGSTPLTYQWQNSGVNLTGGTGSSLNLTNLQLSDAGNYTLVLSNAYGTATSSVAVVQVTAFNITNTFAYWKFDETSGSSAADSSGNGNTGSLISFPGDNSQWVAGRVGGALNLSNTNVGQGYVTAPDSPSLNFTNSLSLSLSAWVKGTPAQITGAGIIAKGYGGNEEYAMDVSGGAFRFYVRNAAALSSPIQSSVGPNNRWQHLIATYDAASGLMNLYVNAQLVSTGPAPTSLLSNSHEVSIGSRESGVASGYVWPFNGVIDDVRIYNRALRTNEVQTLYSSGGPLALTFYAQPQNASAYVGDSVTFTAQADGSDPLTYQWKRNGVNLTGATNTSLTVNNVQLSDNSSSYTLLISNGSGSLSSSGAILSVIPAPAPDLTNNLVAYWAFDETNGTATADSSGNGNSATLYNFPGDDSQWTPGIVGGAIHINAGGLNTEFVSTDNPLTLQNGNQFSFAFWAKRDAGATGTNPRIITPFGTQSWVVYTPGHGLGLLPVATSTEPSSNTWHHFVVLFDRVAGAYSLYVDGNRQISNAGGYSLTDPTSLFWIIGHSENTTTTTDSYNGLLDDLRVYNRLLTPNDAKALYYAGAQPSLASTFDGSSISMTWPRAALGFHLQSTASLDGANTVWTNVGATPIVSADGYTQTVTQSVGSGARFYRLANP